MALTNEETQIVALAAAAALVAEEETKNISTIECMSADSHACSDDSDIKGVLPWVTQPLFWKDSKDLQELFLGLINQCPGGGPAVASLINRFLALWTEYLKLKYMHTTRSNTNKSTKDDDEKAAVHTRGISDMKNKMKFMALALETIVWEKLHTGIWKDVSFIWRDTYSFACLLSACVELETVSELKQRRKRALRCLDLACLMGGNLWRHVASLFISDLVRLIHEIDDKSPSVESLDGLGNTLENDMGNAFSSFLPPPHSPAPQLPPGSLNSSSLSHPVPRHHRLSLETFATDYMLPQHPVIISNAIDSWPALKNWQRVDYWQRHAGPRMVPVEVGKHYMVEGWGQQLMLFSDFLNNHLVYKQPEGIGKEKDKSTPCVYLAQHDLLAQIPHLAQDIHQPEYCSLGQPVHASNTWIGPSGTVTPLHTDPEQNLLCQVVGRKYIRLYAPEQSPALCGGGDGGDNNPNSSLTLNTSPVDVDTHPLLEGKMVESVNEEAGGSSDKSKHTEGLGFRVSHKEESRIEYPLYASEPFLDCILESGEMLYIPGRWWHYVKSLSTSASVNFWWKR
jgi:lysine-specific demethylase 8